MCRLHGGHANLGATHCNRMEEVVLYTQIMCLTSVERACSDKDHNYDDDDDREGQG